jgi:hypothetical protein
MENFGAKTLEHPETQQPETAMSKFWWDIEKKAEQFRNPTAEEKIKGWWDRLTETDNKQYAADGKESGEVRAEQPETLEEMIAQYIEDLKNNSEYSETIKDDGTPWEKISPEENAKMREEFGKKKNELIGEWEKKNSKEWPCCKEDVYSSNGKLIRKAGDRYDAHHIKPLSFGGKNEAGNTTPISAEKHFDKQGVHSPISPYGKIEKTTQGAKIV